MYSRNKSKKINKKYWIGFAVSVCFMGLMGLAASVTGKMEIIFPEAAALVTGSFLMKRRPWNVPHGVSTLLMSVCAFAGVLISRYMELPLYFKVLSAVGLVFLVLLAGGTGMTPAVSACALPVLIGTTDFVYVAAVIVISALCDAGSALFERTGLTEPRGFGRNRNGAHWALMFAVFAAALLVPALSGLKFMSAPPLIVAYVALCAPGGLEQNRPVRTVVLFGSAAVIGYLCRTLSEMTAAPAALWIMIAAAGAFVLMTAPGRFMPPAAAIAILPFILPAQEVWKYPLEVCAGIMLFYLAAAAEARLEPRTVKVQK